jgi:hypothetical protein
MAENDKKAGGMQEPGTKKQQGKCKCKCDCGCVPQVKK